MKYTSTGTTTSRTTIRAVVLTVAFATITGFPALAAATPATTAGFPALAAASPATAQAVAGNSTATLAMSTPRPDAEANPQSEKAAGESAERNDTRADLTGLLKVEDAAEAIAEGEKTGASGLAAGHQTVMLWPGVRATLAQNGAATADLVKVDNTIVALRNDLRSHADIARDANEVTGAMAPLFTSAGDKVPADVHYLDYLGRSIKLDVHGGNWTRARREAAVLESRWSAVRSQVTMRHGGAAAAAEFDKAAAAIRMAVGASNAKATLAATTMTGNAVDTLEKVF